MFFNFGYAYFYPLGTVLVIHFLKILSEIYRKRNLVYIKMDVISPYKEDEWKSK